MDFNEYDHVWIKDKDVTGIIIDVFTGEDGATYYTVEDDKRSGINDPNQFEFPQYDCRADDLEKID